jgi:hypothetical protein
MERKVKLVRMCAVLLLLLILAPSASAIGRADFDAVVDFSVTLKTIAAAAEGNARLPANKLFLLDGTVSDITVLDKEPGSYKVRIRLLSGEWIGLEDVKGYSCFVTVSGAEYAGMFTSKVQTNSRIIVLARAVGVTTTALGEKLMSLDGLALRVLQ